MDAFHLIFNSRCLNRLAVSSLRSIDVRTDIPEDFQNTAVADLFGYHNFAESLKDESAPRLLIGMCMDHRNALRMPCGFAYVIRSGGATLAHSRFHISFAISIGGIHAIAVMGHSKCGMVELDSNRQAFVRGLVNRAGWDGTAAKEHFLESASECEIHNAADFTLQQVQELRQEYPKIPVAPLFYKIEDNRIYWIEE